MWTIAAFIFGLSGVAALSWAWSSARERRRAESALNAVEQRLRQSEAKASGLRQEVGRLKDAMHILDRTLTRERLAKETALQELKMSFRKGSLLFGTAVLALGCLAGGALAGLWAHTGVDMKYRERLTALEVRAAVAKEKNGWLATSNKAMRAELESLRTQLLEERERRAVAEAKLMTLLSYAALRKPGREVTIDLARMKKDTAGSAQSRSVGPAVGDSNLVSISMPSLW